MVHTTISQVERYVSLHPKFAAAFSALQEYAAKPFNPGRYPVDGDALYIVALDYNTKPTRDALLEAHRRYIDIMFLINGKEQIWVCPTDSVAEFTQPYDEAGDAALALPKADCTRLFFQEGDITILFPEDAHAPGIDTYENHHVQKLIAKVLLETPAEIKEG